MFTLPVKTTGVGRLQAALKSQKRARSKALATVSLKVTRSGTHVLQIPLPAAARTSGCYTVRVSTYSPDGKGHLQLKRP